MLGGDPGDPRLQLAASDLHGVTAAAAHDVVVVLMTMAGAVEGLSLGIANLIDLPGLGHGRQVAVDGGQAHARALGLRAAWSC